MRCLWLSRRLTPGKTPCQMSSPSVMPRTLNKIKVNGPMLISQHVLGCPFVEPCAHSRNILPRGQGSRRGFALLNLALSLSSILFTPMPTLSSQTITVIIQTIVTSREPALLPFICKRVNKEVLDRTSNAPHLVDSRLPSLEEAP